MWRAIDVNAVIASLEVCIRNLGHSPVDREVARELEGGFGFVTVGAAWAFEFEAAVVWYVHLLVRMIDEKCIHAEAEPAVIGGDSPLIEVSGCQTRLVRALDNPARVDAVDAPAVVERKGQRDILHR